MSYNPPMPVIVRALPYWELYKKQNMLWWLIPLLLLLTLATYLLFAPFYLEIDSRAGIAVIRYHYMASAALKMENNLPVLLLNILFWRKRIDILEQVLKPSKPKKEKQLKQKNKSGVFPYRQMMAVLKTFRVNKFYLDADTGNMQLNGLLYAPVHMLSVYTGRHAHINFNGRNVLVLQVTNNAARVVWAFLHNKKR